MMKGYVLNVEPTVINVTPYGYRRYARQLIDCFDALAKTGAFSPVPYFLCCRAIELAFKAALLETTPKPDVKRVYHHNLVRAHSDLKDKILLSNDEIKLLREANDLYLSKEFEYFNIISALKGFKNFPDLAKLRALAGRIVAH